MIKFKRGNIFSSEAQTLVNPVNCVGVMGAGLTKAFKAKFPSIMTPYEAVCVKKLIKVGSLQVIKVGNRKILNFPTKEH